MTKSLIIPFLTALVLILPLTGSAQDAKSLEKQYKETISMLKKSNSDIKKVEVAVEPDGYWYFRLIRKGYGGGYLYGAANQAGSVIIQPIYETLYYQRAEPAADCKETVLAGDMYHKYHYNASNNPIFVGLSSKDGYWDPVTTLITTSGKILYKELPYAYKIPGYWVISEERQVGGKNSYHSHYGRGNDLGLLTSDGKELLPPKYYSIQLGKGYSLQLGQKEEDASVGLNQIIFSVNNDGDERKGGMVIDGSLPTTKPIFNSISIFKSDWGDTTPYWSVWKNSHDGPTRYTEGMDNITFLDEGESLYEKHDFDGVIKYYSTKGVDAPWAKFFSGEAAYYKAYINLYNCTEATKYYNNNRTLLISPFDLTEAQQFYDLAQDLLNAYLTGDSIDEKYRGLAESHINSIPKEIASIPELSAKHYEAKIAYQSRAEAKERQRLAELQRKHQEQQQLQAAILGAFFGAVTKALQPSSSRSYATRSTGASSSSSVSSGSKSSGGNADRKAYWESKKRTAESMAERYREQLKKEPNNAAIKHNLRCQEEIIKTCDEMISQY